MERPAKLDSEYADAYYNRAFVFINDKNYKKAIEDLTKSINLDPSYAPQ